MDGHGLVRSYDPWPARGNMTSGVRLVNLSLSQKSGGIPPTSNHYALWQAPPLTRWKGSSLMFNKVGALISTRLQYLTSLSPVGQAIHNYLVI